MYNQKRKKPLILKKLEAIIPRLPNNFPKLEMLKTELAKRYKGYIGELNVDYHLDFLANRFIVLKDIRLGINGRTVQLDSIVISNHGIYCVETKNVNGKVTFDTILKQFIQQDGSTENSYRYPITQAESHRIQLTYWFHENNFPNIPIYYFIAISEPSTIIDVVGDKEEISEIVAHAEYIPQMILKMDRKLNKKPRIPSRQLARMIFEKSVERDLNIFDRYGMNETDILPGVHCPECEWLGMNRVYNNWHCSKCNHRSKYAHKRAFKDYFLLFDPWITNTKCRKFLKISSKNVATRLMKEEGLIYEESTRRWLLFEK